jgi:hypothetical protein
MAFPAATGISGLIAPLRNYALASLCLVRQAKARQSHASQASAESFQRLPARD